MREGRALFKYSAFGLDLDNWSGQEKVKEACVLA